PLIWKTWPGKLRSARQRNLLPGLKDPGRVAFYLPVKKPAVMRGFVIRSHKAPVYNDLSTEILDEGVKTLAMSQQLKFGVSGAAGVGKSTLVAALAKHLEIPPIDEGFDDVIDRSNLKNKQPQAWARELIAILRAKSRQEDACEAFVADRCALDLLHLWGFYRLDKHLPSKPSREFLGACAARIRQYDFIGVTPWGSIPLVESEEGSEVKRNINGYKQMKHQASMLGMEHMLGEKRRIIEIPPTLTDLDKRIDFCLKAVEIRLPMLSKETSS